MDTVPDDILDCHADDYLEARATNGTCTPQPSSEWKHPLSSEQRIATLEAQVAQLQKQVASLQRRLATMEEMHP